MIVCYHPSKVMAISESSRLRTSLRKQNVSVQRLVINQVLPPPVSDCKFCVMRRKVYLLFLVPYLCNRDLSRFICWTLLSCRIGPYYFKSSLVQSYNPKRFLEFQTFGCYVWLSTPIFLVICIYFLCFLKLKYLT